MTTIISPFTYHPPKSRDALWELQLKAKRTDIILYGAFFVPVIVDKKNGCSYYWFYGYYLLHSYINSDSEQEANAYVDAHWEEWETIKYALRDWERVVDG